MSYTTYENYANPHVTIHRDGCSQIKKRGGQQKYGQGKYCCHKSYKQAFNYATKTGLKIIHCSFCRLSPKDGDAYIINVEWRGPYKIHTVIEKMKDGGTKHNDWGGKDYGLYQIYGRHITCGRNALLYVGLAEEQTFSRRFQQHNQEWLNKEKNIKLYLGRIDGEKYYNDRNWRTWRKDLKMTESIQIYKYTPNYNSSKIGDCPKISPYKHVKILNLGKKAKLKKEDLAPEDYL